MCAEGDVTPGGRVFAEASVSATFLRFDELEYEVTRMRVFSAGFVDRSHPLSANLRGMAGQTYDRSRSATASAAPTARPAGR